MLDKRLFKFPGARKALGILSVLTLIQALAIIGQGRFLSIAITDLWQGHKLGAVVTPVLIFVAAYLMRQLMGLQSSTPCHRLLMPQRRHYKRS